MISNFFCTRICFGIHSNNNKFVAKTDKSKTDKKYLRFHANFCTREGKKEAHKNVVKLRGRYNEGDVEALLADRRVRNSLVGAHIKVMPQN